MSQHDQDLQQEQQLLEHFRQHSQGEPSAAVDALILAAARQAIEPPRPSLSQRLHAWLFGAGSRTRWSMAVAGLAVFGIGLNLSLHTREQLPAAYDAPAPLASAPAPALQEMAPARQQSAEPEYKKIEQAAPSFAGAIAPSAPPAAAPQQMAAKRAAEVAAAADSAAASSTAPSAAYMAARAKAEAEVKAKMQAQQVAEQAGKMHQPLAEEAPPLELRLRDVLRLRQEGQQAEADRLLTALQQEYPQQDLEAELKRLQGEVENSSDSLR